MNKNLIYLFLLAFLLTKPVLGQVNFFGKPGLMAIPSAEWNEEQPLGFSFAYIPREYSLFQTNANNNTLNLYSVRMGITSFMEMNLGIAYRPLLKDKIGIGDRQLDFRFKLLGETKFLPSLVLGITPPGSVSPIMSHDYLVATKNFGTGIGTLKVTGGYGSPYIFIRNKESDKNIDIKIRQKKDYYNKLYLTGFFGGITYAPVDFGGIMLEYDTNTINTGAYIKLWDRLYLQAYTFEGKDFAFQLSSHFRLDFSPRALRRYEKRLD